MARSDRLLALIQALREYRRPVSGAALSERLGVSLRTLYRDIDTLRGQGANIQGEAGVGYVLRPGFLLPPMMFAHDEIEALVLGTRWVAEHGDPDLSQAAETALAKIGAVLPDHLKTRLEADTLLVGPSGSNREAETVAMVRAALHAERKIAIRYGDAAQNPTERTVWPIALGFFNNVRVLVAWCELRQDFRHFRLDRIEALTPTGIRYPRRRLTLLAQWRAMQAADRN